MTDETYWIPKYIIKAISTLEPRDRLNCYDWLFKYLESGEEPKKGIEASCITLAKDALDREKRKQETVFGRRCGEYSQWREAVFERDNYTCQKCGQKGGELNAHHILPYSKYPQMRYNVENGITLCKKCHKEEHHGKK